MADIHFRKKSETWWCRAVAAFVPAFSTHFWTTVGSTLYVPTRYDNDPDWGSLRWRARQAQGSVVAHELVHVAQYEELGVFLMLMLVLGPSALLLPLGLLTLVLSKAWGLAIIIGGFATLPLSFGLAYGRWWVERSAYLVSIRHGARIEDVVETLWWDYGFCWPRAWMRAWFAAHSATDSGRPDTTR